MSEVVKVCPKSRMGHDSTANQWLCPVCLIDSAGAGEPDAVENPDKHLADAPLEAMV
jgi:hypothetical protein